MKFRVIMSNCNAISRYGTKKFFLGCLVFLPSNVQNFYFSFIALTLMREHDSRWCSDVIKKHNKRFMLHYIPCHRGFCSYVNGMNAFCSLFFVFCTTFVRLCANSRAIHHETCTKILPWSLSK